MKFNLWRKYGALNSSPVFDAFHTGANALGHDVVCDSDDGVDVIWSVLWNGRMGGNRAIWERNVSQSKPTIVLEVGGITRGSTWKVGLNGINRDAYFGPMGNDSSRANLLGLDVKPWQTDGDHILICGQHDKSLQWHGMPKMSQWLIDTIDQIRKHTDRKIIFRPHPRCQLPSIENEFDNVVRQRPIQLPRTYDDFDINFSNVYATISYSSNPGIHSVINGVPAFVSASSLAFPVANNINDLSVINDPKCFDRRQWVNDYAWTEYTLEEISQGFPLKRLTSLL